MRRVNLYASTALGLCFAVHAGQVAADMPDISDADLQMFAQPVLPCIIEPNAATCVDATALIAQCADDLALARCEALFDDPDAVLNDPEQRARALEILQAAEIELMTQGAIDGVDAPQADTPITEMLDTPQSDIEIQPEPAPDAMLEALTDDTSDDAELLELQQALEAAEAAEAAERAAAQAELEAEAEVQADVELEAEAEAEVETTQPEAEIIAPLDGVMETQPAESDAPVSTEINTDTAISDAELERLLAEERERLLAEADAIGEDAPELLVEDLPEEEFVAPSDQAREPDQEQRATIDRLIETPEVAAALGVLGVALGVAPSDADETPSEDARPLAARAARDDDEDTEASDQADAEASEVLEDAFTAEEMRSSSEDFTSRLSMDFQTEATGQERSSSSRNLERAGLAAIGALAVGMLINQNRVVARSDERVVVDQGDGNLQLWRDDDAILLQDGTTRRIERYSDGSTRSRWMRVDGTEVITIRDATGRVLRRERLLTDGTIVELIDDTRDMEPIIVSQLPPMRTRELRISQRTDPELALTMLREAEADARAVDRSFSLRQIRETRELRELLPLLSTDPITFETNRANVRSDEVSKLLQVGRLMERLIALDPREVFLIEGHTDATGPAAFNLALSDRRAESVALALTEFFSIPPENLVVQGYGKRYLRVPTLAAEERNRRVAIRRMTPLLNR